MKIILTSVLIIIALAVNGQANEASLIQQIYGMEKKAILDDYLQFSDNESKDAFWELYNVYEEKRKELGNKRVDLLQRYVNDYMNMPESEMEDLLNEVTKMNSDYVKLLNSYVKKVNKKVGVKQAAQ
ncbi:MAG: hypothetical protein P8X57_05705, partial [Cyclobacteriaceae bacterium]